VTVAVVHSPLLPQPFRASLTACRISSTVICPSPLGSPAAQVDTAACPKAMFTMVTISSTVT
jgi:hypothetical protein